MPESFTSLITTYFHVILLSEKFKKKYITIGKLGKFAVARKQVPNGSGSITNTVNSSASDICDTNNNQDSQSAGIGQKKAI